MSRTFLAALLFASLGMSNPSFAVDDVFQQFSNACNAGSYWYSGAHGGYNQLMSGYAGYTPLWIAGADETYYLITESRDEKGKISCGDRAMARFSLDYAPLQVP